MVLERATPIGSPIALVAQRPFKDDSEDRRVPGFQGKAKLRQLGRIHDRLHCPEEDLDDEMSGDIVSDKAGLLPLIEQFAEVTADQISTTLFDNLKQLRQFTADVPHKWWLNLSRVSLQAIQQVTQPRLDILSGCRFQTREVCFDFHELLLHDGLDERGLAGEMGVQGFLAHPKFSGKIIHADRSESMGEELFPSRADNPVGRGPTREDFVN